MILPVICHPRTKRGGPAVKRVVAIAVILGLTSPVPAAEPLGKPSDGLRLQATPGTNAPAVFLPGQTIPLDMQVVNDSKALAYPIVKPGDGSESGWREPHVFYDAERLAADGGWIRVESTPILRCGLYDDQWQKDVVTLKPGESLPLKDWLPPPSSVFEFQQAGRYRIRAHYAYRGGMKVKGGEARPAEDVGGMKGIKPFEIVSAPVEITVKRPLNVTLKAKRNLIANQQSVISDLIEVLLVNDSDKPISAAQPTLSAEGRLKLQMRAELGWAPTLDKQDNPHAAKADIQPGQSVSLLGTGAFANGVDGTWTYPRAGSVKLRAGYTPSTWQDIGTVWSEWVEVKVELDTEPLTVTLTPRRGGRFTFGEVADAVFTVKNVSGKAVNVGWIVPIVNRSEQRIGLSGGVYGDVLKDHEADRYLYDGLRQMQSGVSFHTGFLLPGQQVAIHTTYRPLFEVERFRIQYVTADKPYDGTAASLAPLAPYIPGDPPSDPARDGRTVYIPFEAARWQAICEANPAATTPGPDLPKRAVLIPGLGEVARLILQPQQVAEVKVPLDVDDKTLTGEKALAAAIRITGAQAPYLDMAYSAALGGYAVTHSNGCWLLTSADQSAPGMVLPPVPPELLRDIDSQAHVRVQVGNRQEGFGPDQHLSDRTFWNTYPIEYGDGMYTQGEFIRIDKTRLRPFLKAVLDHGGRLGVQAYYFKSRYFTLRLVQNAAVSPQTIEQYLDRLRQLLPKGWSLQADLNVLKVIRNEPVEWYNPNSLPFHEHTADLKAMGLVHAGKYEIALQFEVPYSGEKVQALRQQNERTAAEIGKLAEKMKPFLVRSAKPDLVRRQYRPESAQDEALLKQYNDLQAAVVRLPDVNNPDASIFVDMPFREPLALYDPNVAQECARVAESLGKILSPGDAWTVVRTDKQGEDKATPAPNAGPRLRWIDRKTARTLFGANDIARFDWDRQVFELSRAKAMDLAAQLPPHMMQWLEFEVRDGENLLYEGRFINSRASLGYRGPTILFPSAEIKPPLYAIQGGYPTGTDGTNQPHRVAAVESALKRAGVLAAIPPGEKPHPIERLSSEWIGPPDGLKIRAEIFPETFRIGESARVHLFFADASRVPPMACFEVHSTVASGDAKFFCTTEHTVQKPATAAEILKHGIWVLQWKPWGPVRGAEQSEARPGPAEVTFRFVVRDPDGKAVAEVNLPAQKITVLP